MLTKMFYASALSKISISTYLNYFWKNNALKG